MKYTIHSGISILGLLLILVLTAGSQTIPHSVISGGATNAKAGNSNLRGTLSQTSIGRLAQGGMRHNVGFWYAAQSALLNGGTLVVLPQAEGTTGVLVKIPLLLQQSKNLITTTYRQRSFEATLRFNATVAEPVLPYKRVGDVGTITVSGTTSDSAGILAEIDFIPKLGNAEKTSLEIISFVWKDAPTMKTITKNGEIHILNVCREGDSIRLVRSVAATMLAAYPNPASDHVTVDYTLGEHGTTVIEMIDMQGKTVTTLLSGTAKAGTFSERLDVMLIPNGAYFLRMRTPNELLTTQITIHK